MYSLSPLAKLVAEPDVAGKLNVVAVEVIVCAVAVAVMMVV
jgi:hypothetical protein